MDIFILFFIELQNNKSGGYDPSLKLVIYVNVSKNVDHTALRLFTL